MREGEAGTTEVRVRQIACQCHDREKVLALARDWPVSRKYELDLEAVIVRCN
jgi:hypothetical protein